MPKTELTTDEIIATLNHSSVTTILSEGRGDLIALRRLEDRFADIGLSALPAGGRGEVLKVFRRRGELKSQHRTLFFADLDCWVYEGIPHDYVDETFLFTDGYSIENDLYRDGRLERLLTETERAAFRADLERFVRWYSVVLKRRLADSETAIATSPIRIIQDTRSLEEVLDIRDGESCPSDLFSDLWRDYVMTIRGKSLMGILLRSLSASDRQAKYSYHSLMEIGAISEGELMRRLSAWAARNCGRSLPASN